MSEYGFRDGVFNVRALKRGQKRFVQDQYVSPVASSEPLASAFAPTSIATIVIGTQIDYPRAVKIQNNLKAASERALKIKVKGYTGQGEYEEETLTLSTAATGEVRGNVAFAYLDSAVPDTTTKGYGTYGTVSIKPTNKFGLTEYCDAFGDIKGILMIGGTTLVTKKASTMAAGDFNKTYQTLDMSGIKYTSSTMVIKYLSKFQKRLK